jgi:hypothetical protein
VRAPQANAPNVSSATAVHELTPTRPLPMHRVYSSPARSSKRVFAAFCIAAALASAGCETRCGDLAHEVCQRACECGGCAIQTQNPEYWSRTPTFELCVERFEFACRYIPEDTIDCAACEDTLDSAVCTGRIGAVLLDPVCEGIPYVNSDREPEGTLPDD